MASWKKTPTHLDYLRKILQSSAEIIPIIDQSVFQQLLLPNLDQLVIGYKVPMAKKCAAMSTS